MTRGACEDRICADDARSTYPTVWVIVGHLMKSLEDGLFSSKGETTFTMAISTVVEWVIIAKEGTELVSGFCDREAGLEICARHQNRDELWEVGRRACDSV